MSELTSQDFPFQAELQTGGDGLWSNALKSVKVTGMSVMSWENKPFELRVQFDKNTWNVYEDGLIYTDETFLSELQSALRKFGFSDDVEYSEQGMQSEDYVSLDIDEDFL